jgi:hypothetical protein
MEGRLFALDYRMRESLKSKVVFACVGRTCVRIGLGKGKEAF